MVCTADDLLRFAGALSGTVRDPGPWRPAGPGKEVGRGLFRFATPFGPRIGHHGNVLGFTAGMWWTEDRQAVAALVANVGTVHAGGAPALRAVDRPVVGIPSGGGRHARDRDDRGALIGARRRARVLALRRALN